MLEGGVKEESASPNSDERSSDQREDDLRMISEGGVKEECFVKQ